jgi:hypothetical protein
MQKRFSDCEEAFELFDLFELCSLCCVCVGWPEGADIGLATIAGAYADTDMAGDGAGCAACCGAGDRRDGGGQGSGGGQTVDFGGKGLAADDDGLLAYLFA